MAAQVLSGTGNVTYTNSTGQNVRICINYLSFHDATYGELTITSAAGQNTTFETTAQAVYGKYIGTLNMAGDGGGYSNHAGWGSKKGSPYTGSVRAIPIEFALENGANFTATVDTANFPKYNIIIIPEAG